VYSLHDIEANRCLGKSDLKWGWCAVLPQHNKRG